MRGPNRLELRFVRKLVSKAPYKTVRALQFRYVYPMGEAKWKTVPYDGSILLKEDDEDKKTPSDTERSDR